LTSEAAIRIGSAYSQVRRFVQALPER
jgi:hypothetical protein